ncbi:MAG: M48 family metalloprotease [Thermoanaerobaculia bacterium]|nr:M48 family metalloprotease [Thermoanaerobaculia bacterium]
MRNSSRIATCLLTLALTGGALFADSSVGEAPPGPETPPVLVIPEAARATPDFDVERATEAYLALISPEARERSDAYFEGGYWLDLVGWLWTLGVAALFAAGGRANRIHQAIQRRIPTRFGADALTAGVLLAASAVVSLPLTLWTGYFREHAYQLSNQTLAAFLGDWVKGLGFGLLLGGPAIAVLYLLVRRLPSTWWLWGSAVFVFMMMVMVAISPVFIDPVFNKYQVLEEGALRDEILSTARSHRIPADDVYWFDASRQHKRISANVAGFAGTMRIALNDNLLRRSPKESVLAVLGHEMGHFVLNHIVELLIQFGLIILAGFAFVHFAFLRVARRFPSWELGTIANPGGLLVAIALFGTFEFLATPAISSIIRSNEAEADAFGLAIARQPDGFAYAAVQLSEYRKMRPGKLEEIVFFDHPSGYDRIRRAMEWKKENLAECAEKEAAAAKKTADRSPGPPSVELPTEMAAVLRGYEAAWSAKDAQGLAGLFAPDGFVLGSGRPFVRGRAAIAESYAGQGYPMSLRAVAHRTDGRVGWIAGAYRNAGADHDLGKFLLTLEKGEDGRWQIAADMDNGLP